MFELSVWFFLASVWLVEGYVLSSSQISFCTIDGEQEPTYNGSTCNKKLVMNIAAMENMGPYWYEFDKYVDVDGKSKSLGTTFLVALERSKTYVSTTVASNYITMS